ncbi:shikimate dehydrogenase [soil metagenome]
MGNESRKRLGIIGDPVAHSISPAMQQPALDALGIAATYERWQTPLEELPARIESLRAADVLGANVTIPHKQAVIPMIDEVSPLALKAGAVNTIVNRDGRLFGDNTDVYGFVTALQQACMDLAGREAVILGAGGASRAVVLGLVELGVEKITLVNRNRERAEKLRDDLGVPSVEITDSADSLLPSTGLLINATSLGWHIGEMPIEAELLDLLPQNALVADLTYRETDLLIAAEARGLQTLDGLGMLVYQGVLAFERFTGQSAPVDIMWAAALQARAPRG